MKLNKSFIYIIAVLILFSSITANTIPDIHVIKRKVKRDDPANSAAVGDSDVKPTPTEPNQSSVVQDQPTPQPSSETSNIPENPVVTDTSSNTTPPAPSPSPTTDDKTDNKTDNKTDDKTDDKTNTNTDNHTDNKTDDSKSNSNDISNNSSQSTSDTSNNPSSTSNSSSSSSNSSSTSSNSSSSSSNTNSNSSSSSSSSNNSKKKGGLSGGIIALIVLGGIFAFGVVCLILRALFKLCTKKNEDEPLPVINVVSNTSSTEGLKPQEPMVENGQYYNQSQYSSQNPVGGSVVSDQQYYDNGVDLANTQYQNVNDYNNGYDYPQQDQVVQPVRQFSSLRRPTATSGAPPDGYNQSMISGEITDVNQVPHKVIINKSNNTPIEPGTIHKTQFPFTPNMDDELKLNAGDAVEIIEVYDDGWSYGRNMTNNEVGVFPISYITGYNDPSNNF